MRAIRKRNQIESFATVLAQIIPMGPRNGDNYHIVDFGCGTGALCLSLAFIFPYINFTGVDMNGRSIELLLQRAKAGGLTNVRGVVAKIETFNEKFDVGMALHACGLATDFALRKTEHSRAAYIMCPCCVGKLKFGFHNCDTDGNGNENSRLEESISHPQSQWLRDALHTASISNKVTDCGDAVPSVQHVLAAMARAGDISHGEAHESTVGQRHPYVHEARLCKCHLELDRNMYMKEKQYHTCMMKLFQFELTSKSDLLVGVPSEAVGSGDMLFPWQ